jgi:hypothetical protein
MMMKEKNSIRKKGLNVRLSDEEDKKLLNFYNRTTCQTLSEYARDVLLKEPVTIRYRSQSADDFLNEMILLKRELNAIGNNLSQAVHKLHTLDHSAEIKAWYISTEQIRQMVLKKTIEIQERLNQIHEQWSRK